MRRKQHQYNTSRIELMDAQPQSSKLSIVGISKDGFDRILREKNELLIENETLKKRIADLFGEAEVRHNMIMTLEVTLSELREENQLLKDKLKNVETRLDELDLQNKNSNLRHEYGKWLIALQDLNSHLRLEHHVPNLKFLRQDRVGQAHYIDDNDSTELKNFKIALLRGKMGVMSLECQGKLEKKFGSNFLRSVEGRIPSIGSVTVSPAAESDAEDWWWE